MLDNLSVLGGIVASFLVLRFTLGFLPVKPSPSIIAQLGVPASVGLAWVLVMFVLDVASSSGADWFNGWVVFFWTPLVFSWVVAVLGLEIGLHLPSRTCKIVGFAVGLAFLVGAIAPDVFMRIVHRLIAKTDYAGG